MSFDDMTRCFMGFASIIATGSESIPDLWKMLITGAGMIILASVLYRVLRAQIVALEEEIKTVRNQKQIKDEQYAEAIADAQTFKALYDSLKADYELLKAKTNK